MKKKGKKALFDDILARIQSVQASCGDTGGPSAVEVRQLRSAITRIHFLLLGIQQGDLWKTIDTAAQSHNLIADDAYANLRSLISTAERKFGDFVFSADEYRQQ